MSTATPPPRPGPLLPETLTDEHHEALRRSWELPAYEKPAPQAVVRSHRTLIVGLLSGALGLAIGTSFGYWAASENTTGSTVESPVVVTTVPKATGYSATHDSRIIEAPQTMGFGRWTRPVIVRIVNPQ